MSVVTVSIKDHAITDALPKGMSGFLVLPGMASWLLLHGSHQIKNKIKKMTKQNNATLTYRYTSYTSVIILPQNLMKKDELTTDCFDIIIFLNIFTCYCCKL